MRNLFLSAQSFVQLLLSTHTWLRDNAEPSLGQINVDIQLDITRGFYGNILGRLEKNHIVQHFTQHLWFFLQDKFYMSVIFYWPTCFTLPLVNQLTPIKWSESDTPNFVDIQMHPVLRIHMIVHFSSHFSKYLHFLFLFLFWQYDIVNSALWVSLTRTATQVTAVLTRLMRIKDIRIL